jgi:hypothetical protein
MNGYAIKQATAVQPLVFLMVDSTDHITGKTGLSPTVTISKNGAAFASPAGAVSEIGNGLYAVAANATDSETLGPLVLHATATGADPVDWLYPIVAYDPLTVAVGANTATPPTVGAIADQVWDEARSGHATAGTFGEKVNAELDSATATQIDTIEAALTTLGSDSTTVERSVSDTNAITFSWPVSGATITGTASLNNGSYGAVAGAIAFLRTETGRHYYTLAYNVADRPAAEGQVRYKFVDGTYTGYVVLRTVNLVTTAQVNAQVLDVLSVDTFAELTAPPAATSSLKDKITWLFMYARNKVTQTATTRTLYRDDTTTVAGTSTTSDNGTTFTKGEDA